MGVSLVPSSILMLAALLARAEVQPPYPGLLSEMRAADLVVLVKAEKVEPSHDRDPRTQTIVQEQVSGPIIEVYKGEAKKGQTIEILVPYAEHSLRMERQLYVLGHLFFSYAPRPGESVVFLLKGKSHQVVNITVKDPIVPQYARISRLRTDAEVAVALARLYAQLTLVENESSHTGPTRLTVDDLKRYYQHLDEKGDAFAKMVSGFREATFEAIRKGDEQLGPALWLGSYLPETDRKKLVRLLLEQYAENAKELEKARKAPPRPKFAPPPNEGSSPGAGAPAPDPVTGCLARADFLLYSMNLLMDLSWHVRVSRAKEVGELIPWDRPQAETLSAEDALAKANKFVER